MIMNQYLKYFIIIFANSVADASILMREIAGYDANDSTSSKVNIPDYFNNLNHDIKGKIIGIPEEYTLPGIPAEVNIVWDKAIKIFENTIL